MSNTDYDLPKYDGTITMTKYLSLLKDYKFKLLKPKYDKILEFINLWLKKYNIELKSLTDFKKIPQDKLLSNNEHNSKILKKYSDSLLSYLNAENMKYDSEDSSSDELEKLEREYNIKNNILDYIKEILKTINYTLKMNKVKSNNNEYILCYSIINNN